MIQHVDADYENGVLRPLGSVRLAENQQVALTIQDGKPAVPEDSTQDKDGETMLRPWRGVFIPEAERETIFTKEVPIGALPAWEPEILLNPRRERHDDE